VKQDSISSVAISASAGSGKTFQLAHRYIRLMANGVSPDRIIALTFSRKAAGEIFDSVVKHLCDASVSPQGARRTGELIAKPDLPQRDFLRLLRVLLVSISSLHISTLDSFTVGILRSFPMELGIPSAFQIMDSDSGEAKTAGRRVLGRIFDHRRVAGAAQQAFLDAFRQATFGQETKNLDRSLDDFITGFRERYCLMPDAGTWGEPDTIWPGGAPWFEPPDDLAAAAAELKASLPEGGFSNTVTDNLTGIIDFCSGYGESSYWDARLSKTALFQSLLDGLEDLERGQFTLCYSGRNYPLTSRQCRLLFTLLRHVMGIEIRAALRRTRGLYQVLHQYEQFYDDMVRRRGQLTFTDAQYLLTAANRYSSGSVLSRTPGEEARLYIDYRLDCKLDHWLLDEFQDTSDLQWEVLRNLADEVLQDAAGQRSFFYVGDVKQAIYGWRGGNARLFGRILEQYRGRIEQIPLSVSFRSCQPVIDTVNRVFGSLPGEGLPRQAVADWERIWQEHRCQQGVVPEHGYAAILEPPCQGGDFKPGNEDRYRAVASLLREIRPLERGLSVAILVRKNDVGKEIVDFLRGECPGMPVVHEGRAAIKDNPVVSALLSLIKFAAHPGDTFAWRHLQMSPLNSYFAGRGLHRDGLPLMLLRDTQVHGFQAFMRTWGKRLDAAASLDDFGRKRLNDLINAAGEFDGTGSSSCADFLRFIDNYQLHEPGTDTAVRVMTVHQSKGLGFDIVILPELQGNNMARSGDTDFVIARDPDTGAPHWALKMPRTLIAEHDPVLAGQVQQAHETACFDALCVLYVALTRARQGLYMITAFPGKTARAMSPAAFLKSQLAGDPGPTCGTDIDMAGQTLTCLYETGERDWYLKAPPRARPVTRTAPLELPADFGRQPSLKRRLLGVSPSILEGREIRADSLFTHVTRDSMELGQAIHELFEKVSWLDEVDIENLVRDWQEASRVSQPISNAAVEQFRRAVASPQVRQALSRPEGDVLLWREKHFEIVLEDQWITGVFDRVTIRQDPAGRPLQATILDYKSNEVTGDADLAATAEYYRPQLQLYGRALSRMLQIDPAQTTLQILFTHAGSVHTL
jgi:ATP-dependent helicase/nuclease subunit A